MEKIIATIEKTFSFLLHTESIWLKMVYKSFAILLVSFFIWLIIKKLVAELEKKSKKWTRLKIDTSFFRLIRKVLAYTLFLTCGTYFIRLFGLLLIEKPFQAFFIILIAGPVNQTLLLISHYIKEHIAKKTDTNVDDIIFDLLNKFSGVIIYVIASITALDLLGINVMPFIAGAGVLGVAIGFASKDTLSNLIAGVLLILDRPFEIGDRIEVWSAPKNSATWGDVLDIGIRATKIKTTDNIIIVIPNNEIMTRDIVNYTQNSSAIRVRINIGVAYETDLDAAKYAIISVAKSMEWALDDPAPRVVVRNFGESSIDLQLRVWIKNARRRMDTISYVTDNVKMAFDENGIEIPFPRRDITVYHQEKKMLENIT